MFSIGWSELLLIGVLALVVIGPKELPGAMRNFGRGVRALRRMAGDFQTQFNDALKDTEFDDVRKEFNSLRNDVHQMSRPLALEPQTPQAKPLEDKPKPPAEIAPPPLPDLSPPETVELPLPLPEPASQPSEQPVPVTAATASPKPRRSRAKPKPDGTDTAGAKPAKRVRRPARSTPAETPDETA